MTTPITVAYGDGSGPEVMEATLTILRESGAGLVVDSIEIGQRIYNMGSLRGILPSSFEALRQSRVLLKGPTFCPEGAKSVTEIICKQFELDESHRTVRHYDGASGMSATAYINERFALFEPVMEISDATRKNIANPSAIILASVMMLEHVGQQDIARLIQDAWQRTLEKGIHTRDIYERGVSREKVSTSEFTEAVIERLHQPAFS
jgi:isocitrate/isopropylmalate dehydrogenase